MIGKSSKELLELKELPDQYPNITFAYIKYLWWSNKYEKAFQVCNIYIYMYF